MKKQLKSLLGMGITNLVGVGLIGATAGAVSTIPAGTTKTIAGIIPGVQAASLVGHNLKFMPKLKFKKLKL